jgi:DNA-binding PadR family transcriptional regulator
VTEPPASDPRSFLPLTPHAFQVLLALADDERHGYGIILEVGARTDGVIRLRTGTLYVLLQRLSDEGLVALASKRSPREESDSGSAGARASGGGAPLASKGSPREEREDSRRRYYRLTDLGRDVLAAEARRLEAALVDARRKRVFGAPRPR